MTEKELKLYEGEIKPRLPFIFSLDKEKLKEEVDLISKRNKLSEDEKTNLHTKLLKFIGLQGTNHFKYWFKDRLMVALSSFIDKNPRLHIRALTANVQYNFILPLHIQFVASDEDTFLLSQEKYEQINHSSDNGYYPFPQDGEWNPLQDPAGIYLNGLNKWKCFSQVDPYFMSEELLNTIAPNNCNDPDILFNNGEGTREPLRAFVQECLIELMTVDLMKELKFHKNILLSTVSGETTLASNSKAREDWKWISLS